MKIFQGTEIKKIDAYTIEHEPVESIELMERAAKALTKAITARWNKDHSVKIFAGPGNNGGDALAIARLLSEKGYAVEAFLFNTSGKLSDDCQANMKRLPNKPNLLFTEVTSSFDPPELTKKDIIIDGLFGSGLNKPLTGGFASVVKYINASPSTVIAIDIPSGLMSEDNSYNTIKSNIIHADLTLSLQLPKLAFLFAENEEFVGEWELLDIELSKEAIDSFPTDYVLTEEDEIRKMVKPRKHFAHKGSFGHALLIAGSYGMAGSSVLSAKACLRSGVGLLTIHAPAHNNDILQVSVPEAMIQQDIYEGWFATPVDTDSYQAVGIGPGIGKEEETASALLEQLRLTQVPLVLDADALNILSENREWLSHLPANSVLTPHPKELDRLVGKSQNSFDRLSKARDLAAKIKVYIVLKGAYTAVVTPGGKCYFNPTGNSGMATGGSGDVLTGIILSLLAQGYKSEEACRLGVYVHGLAGDIAAEQKGKISLIAGDIIDSLPAAWTKLS